MKSIQVLKPSISNTNSIYPQLIKSSWPQLLTIFIIVQAHLAVFLFYSKNHPHDQSIQMLSQIGIGTVGLLEAVFLLILIPLRTNDISENTKTSYWGFFRNQIAPLTIEGIRMTAFVILWSLLLLLPGLYKQTKWYLMPFTVMFDKEYQAGNIDVLKRSNQLVTGIFPLIFLLMVFEFGFSLTIDNIALSVEGPIGILAALGAGVLTMGVSVYTYSLYYQIYKIRNNEVPHLTAEEA